MSDWLAGSLAAWCVSMGLQQGAAHDSLCADKHGGRVLYDQLKLRMFACNTFGHFAEGGLYCVFMIQVCTVRFGIRQLTREHINLT